jgi:hypothetical protein
VKKHLVILLLASISFSVFSQKKGDNVIMIKNFTEKSDLAIVKRILIMSGYEISQIDTTENYFSTELYPIEGSVYATNLKVKILGFVNDNNLVLTANYTSQYSNLSGGSSDASGRASYENRKLIAKRLAFDELQRISLKINSDITYSKE